MTTGWWWVLGGGVLWYGGGTLALVGLTARGRFYRWANRSLGRALLVVVIAALPLALLLLWHTGKRYVESNTS